MITVVEHSEDLFSLWIDANHIIVLPVPNASLWGFTLLSGLFLLTRCFPRSVSVSPLLPRVSPHHRGGEGIWGYSHAKPALRKGQRCADSDIVVVAGAESSHHASIIHYFCSSCHILLPPQCCNVGLCKERGNLLRTIMVIWDETSLSFWLLHKVIVVYFIFTLESVINIPYKYPLVPQIVMCSVNINLLSHNRPQNAVTLVMTGGDIWNH